MTDTDFILAFAALIILNILAIFLINYTFAKHGE